jgi:hypothetical protein
MPRQNETDIIRLIQTILSEHEDYWKQERANLKRYRDVYENEFWSSSWSKINSDMIRVETADCFSYVEGFIASLFSRNPAVVVGKDAAMIEGTPELAQEVANRFLFDKREHLENGSRLGLIYPCSFFKFSPQQSDDLLERVSIRALPCWEVIVDMDASSWDAQRFAGHVYYLSLPEARERFGNRKFNPIPKEDYFKAADKKYSGKIQDLPDDYLYIKIVELYDFAYDQVYFWSHNYSQGEKLLLREQIPLRTYDDQPLSPIVPLYYSKKPEKPMCGLSAVARVYDQFYEKNILRTYWANAVRRDSRQYLYKEGSFDEEALAKITSGVDGAMIGVDEESLAGLIASVGVEPISTNFDRYQNYIEQDINRGSILAPFSRGEATKATATEITALAQYSASEIGKLARERDGAIEQIALVYLRMIALLAEENELATIEVNGVPKIITAQDLDAKFKIVALDQSSTPLSEAIKKNNLVQLLPILQGLGVPMSKVKEEIIRLYDLPRDFLEEEAPAPAPIKPTTPPEEQRDIGASGELPAEQLAQSLLGGQ